MGFPGTGVINGCEPTCGCWDSNFGPLEEQRVLLTTEWSLYLKCIWKQPGYIITRESWKGWWQVQVSECYNHSVGSMPFGGLTRGTWATSSFTTTKDKKTQGEQELLHWSVWGRWPAMMGSGWDHANRFMAALWKRELSTEHFHSASQD